MNFTIENITNIVNDPLTCQQLQQEAYHKGFTYSQLLDRNVIFALITILTIILMLIFVIGRVTKSVKNKTYDEDKLINSLNFQLTILYFGLMMFLFMFVRYILGNL